MEAMRQSWTDDRLDDLSRRMDDGFNRIDTMIQVGGALFAGVMGVIAAIIGLMITQL
jgi:hypothetical protein